MDYLEEFIRVLTDCSWHSSSFHVLCGSQLVRPSLNGIATCGIYKLLMNGNVFVQAIQAPGMEGQGQGKHRLQGRVLKSSNVLILHYENPNRKQIYLSWYLACVQMSVIPCSHTHTHTIIHPHACICMYAELPTILHWALVIMPK